MDDDSKIIKFDPNRLPVSRKKKTRRPYCKHQYIIDAAFHMVKKLRREGGSAKVYGDRLAEALDKADLLHQEGRDPWREVVEYLAAAPFLDEDPGLYDGGDVSYACRAWLDNDGLDDAERELLKRYVVDRKQR